MITIFDEISVSSRVNISSGLFIPGQSDFGCSPSPPRVSLGEWVSAFWWVHFRVRSRAGCLGWGGGGQWGWEHVGLDIYFCLFFKCCCRGLISGGRLGTPPKIEIFLRPTSLVNSYTKFVILDIKFRFTCGESDLY